MQFTYERVFARMREVWRHNKVLLGVQAVAIKIWRGALLIMHAPITYGMRRHPYKAVFLIIAMVTVGAGYIHYAYGPTPPLPQWDDRAAIKYFQTQFAPRFRFEDCVVGIDYAYHDEKPGNEGADVVFRESLYYLITFEPRSAFTQVTWAQNLESGLSTFLIAFPNDCDRKFEMARGIISFIKKRYRRTMTLHLDKTPNLENFSPSARQSFWID